ncbi:MAG: DUF1501 domain-containing protein [Planctomycetota bacterium]
MSLHLNPSDANAYTRRRFLHGTLAFASASAFVPAFLQDVTGLLPQARAGTSSVAGADEGRVLVVIQLSGGNDGLNMLAPVGLDEYRRARPGISLTERDSIALDGRFPGLSLHPSMDAVKELYDQGLCSIVQGVGYPNPNRSHFKSMDIWQTADLSGTGTGWLGRYFDSECCGFGGGESGSAPSIAIGGDAPSALEGRSSRPIVFEDPDLFRWSGAASLESAAQDLVEHAATEAIGDSPADFLARTALDARVNSETIRRAVSLEPLVRYPGSSLGQQLQMIASMIRAGLPTRVYYAVHGGFDTHAGQGGARGRHSQLLRQLSDAIGAFYNDLGKQRNDGRVLTMTFSEFGRRLGQNGSGGTDHGTAAPLMLFGPMVKPGLTGRHPSLRQLQDGDLIHTVDFRNVYNDVLTGWLQADGQAVLGARYRQLGLIRT